MVTLLNSKQLAYRLNVSMRTLDSLQKNGQLPSGIRIGRQRRWRDADIDAWIKAKAEEGSVAILT